VLDDEVSVVVGASECGQHFDSRLGQLLHRRDAHVDA
jgi:hypothetical protein